MTLKEEINKALKAAFPDVQDSRQFEHAADAVVEIVIKVIGGAIGVAIAAYEEGIKSTSDT